MKLFLKILLIVLWVALAGGAVVLMSFANLNHDQKPCTGLDIIIKDNGSEPLFTTLDLREQLVRKFGKFEKRTLAEVDVEQIIKALRKNPDISSADAHLSIEGTLVVEIEQCRPLVRLIDNAGQNFYLDTKGKLLPANPRYPARVVVASGNFFVPLQTGKNIFPADGEKQPNRPELTKLAEIFHLAEMMTADSVTQALIEQIYISSNGDILLATRAGSHVVVFGDTSDAAEKFEKLKIFYKQGLTKTGWDKYRIINLTYKNQVVGTK